MYKATVEVMLKRSVLDPQGAAVERALKSYGHEGIAAVRVGKLIEIETAGESREAVEAQVADWADKLLVNPIMETGRIKVEEL